GDRNHDVRIDIVAAECALWPEVADATKRLIAIVAAQTDQQISRLECHAVGEEIAKGDFAVSNRIWKDDGRQNVSDAIVPAQVFSSTRVAIIAALNDFESEATSNCVSASTGAEPPRRRTP